MKPIGVFVLVAALVICMLLGLVNFLLCERKAAQIYSAAAIILAFALMCFR